MALVTHSNAVNNFIDGKAKLLKKRHFSKLLQSGYCKTNGGEFVFRERYIVDAEVGVFVEVTTIFFAVANRGIVLHFHREEVFFDGGGANVCTGF